MDLGSMSEAAFQSLVLDAVRRLGLQAYHTHDSRRSQPGFPDLVIVGSKGIIYRELKTSTGRVSKDQEYWLTILKDAGADAAVWRPYLWAEPILKELRALGRLATSVPPKSPKIPRQRTW